jgi:hypothetical protein
MMLEMVALLALAVLDIEGEVMLAPPERLAGIVRRRPTILEGLAGMAALGEAGVVTMVGPRLSWTSWRWPRSPRRVLLFTRQAWWTRPFLQLR